MQQFCRALPEDRLLQGNDYDLDTLLERENGKRTYTISSTGAKLTYHSSIAILARYASSLVSIIVLLNEFIGLTETSSNTRRRHRHKLRMSSFQSIIPMFARSSYRRNPPFED